MTIKEALEVLRKYYGCRTTTGCGSLGNLCDRCEYDVDADTVTEALKTVLDALSGSGDLISRKEAIDICQKRLYETALNNIGCELSADDVYSEMAEKRIANWINEVPPVQASTSQTKFKPGDKFLLEIGERRIGLDEYEIVGTDLYVWGSLLEKLTLYEPNKDTISRQAAIDVIEDIETARLKGEIGMIYAPAIKGLRALPPVQPEEKTGEWVVTSEFEDCRYVKCNQCKVTQVFYYNKPLTNFCPNCGADMRGDTK
jgi:hypothetical protein